MSARPDERRDAGLADVAKMLADLTATIRAANDLNLRNATGFSAAELRVAANVKPSAPCILEEDATLRFGGREISLTLRAYGRWRPFYPGDSGGRGERRLSPPEPAGFEISEVTISTSGPECDIDFALDSKAIEEIAAAAAEEADE